MNTKRLWEMYEESLTKEFLLREAEKTDKNYLTIMESVTQNGITNGILRCLEELGEDKNKTFQKAFHIHKKIRGLDISTENSYEAWIPVADKLPERGERVIACFDDGFIASVELEEDGEWGLWQDSGDVVAWMPLPQPYVEQVN